MVKSDKSDPSVGRGRAGSCDECSHCTKIGAAQTVTPHRFYEDSFVGSHGGEGEDREGGVGGRRYSCHAGRAGGGYRQRRFYQFSPGDEDSIIV